MINLPKETLKDQILYSLPQTFMNSSGWYPVLCKVCNDHGKKGPRAAFKFGDNDNVIQYHCFNCKHHSMYDPEKSSIIDNNTKTTLESFGISTDILLPYQFLNLGKPKQQATSDGCPIKIPDPIQIPDNWTLLDVDNPLHTDAILYLYKRNIDINSYPFFLSTDKKWMDRIIIPIFNDKDEMIFYQGRLYKPNSKSPTSNRKYISAEVNRSSIIYGYDIHSQDKNPIYITEGWFDAYSIGGCCIFENTLTCQQIKLLNRTNREKIYIPDKFGDGQIGAHVALKQGWSISTPDIGNCKDMNQAVVKYGKLYVLSSIIENTHSGFAGQTAVSLWCK